MQHVGIGPVLQEARLQRGKSIEEASRETRIRAEYLQALEGERFDSLLGDVYARAFLRSYSTYLGLDASKVLTIYNRHFGVASADRARSVPDGVRFRRLRRASGRSLRSRDGHPSWTVLIAGAVVALVALGAAGLLARSSAPKPVPSGRQGPIAALPPTVIVSVKAIQPVRLTIRIDGGPVQTYLLRGDESRSFEGANRIEVSLDHGGLTELSVDGVSLGKPGEPTGSYSASFAPRDIRSSPSPATTP